MLVYVRPSNEALLRARVPGAQDQRGRPSNPFLSCAFREQEDGQATLPIPANELCGWGLDDAAGGVDFLPRLSER